MKIELEAKQLIQLATETMRACKAIITTLQEGLTFSPELVGLRVAGKMFSRSEKWLRDKLENGELTGYREKPGTPWKVDPVVLKQELKTLSSSKEPSKRKESKQRMNRRLGL